MKKSLFILFFNLMSFNSFAENLYPGLYKNPEKIVRILVGGYDNLINPNCAKELLDITINRANFSIGNKIIGLDVELGVENGRSFFYIWPEFDKYSLGKTASKCYISSL